MYTCCQVSSDFSWMFRINLNPIQRKEKPKTRAEKCRKCGNLPQRAKLQKVFGGELQDFLQPHEFNRSFNGKFELEMFWILGEFIRNDPIVYK